MAVTRRFVFFTILPTRPALSHFCSLAIGDWIILCSSETEGFCLLYLELVSPISITIVLVDHANGCRVDQSYFLNFNCSCNKKTYVNSHLFHVMFLFHSPWKTRPILVSRFGIILRGPGKSEILLFCQWNMPLCPKAQSGCLWKYYSETAALTGMLASRRTIILQLPELTF